MADGTGDAGHGRRRPSPMKRIALSLAIGCGLTWALYVYANHPRSGPTFLTKYVLTPIYLFLTAVSPSGLLGEIVACALTILLISLVTYLALVLFAILFRRT